MANPFCLIGQHADDFIMAIKSGKLDPIKLQNMESAARHAEFSKVVGEANAEKLNAAFESKLLLKNQQAGLIRWITQSTEPGSPIQRDLLARVDRMDQRILNPRALKDFYADLAKQKLGFGVTMQEVGQITQLAKDVATTKAQAATTGDWLPYGRAKVSFGNYMSDLKNNVPQPATFGRAVQGIGSFSKAIKATGDNSALFRQGWKTLLTNPGIWSKNAAQSFVDLAKSFGGKRVMDEVNAQILSRENSRNGMYQKAKLAIGNIEEEFPTSLPEKIPGLGRVFKASEEAYKSFLYKTRADVFDKMIEIGKRSGEDITDKAWLEGTGNLVNSLTGRAGLGKFEAGAGVINNFFFSPRKMVADFHTLTSHLADPKATPFVKKQAATNLLKIAGGTATLLMIADQVHPGSVEWDPRSADFGKIKIGNTRYDVTGGMGSMLTVAARMALVVKNTTTGSTTPVLKSSVTGKLQQVNTGKFGAKTGGEIATDFFANKASPLMAVLIEVLNDEDFNRQPLTAGRAAMDFAAPIPITNAIELFKDPSVSAANMTAAMIADGLGISTNTYGAKKKPVPKKQAPVKKP